MGGNRIRSPLKYIGGHVTEFLDVDVDRMSYFELRDYIKELGYIVDCDFFIKWDELLVLVDNDKVIFDLFNMINDGDTVEVYVFYGVSEANHAPLELEFVPNVSDSGVGDTNEDTEVDSDDHQEYINIRASKRHFKRSQRRSRGTNSYQINVDEKGPDIGYDETNIGIRESLVGKLGGDEPYYLSYEAPNFEIDDETSWGDGEEVDQVVHKPVRKKKIPNRVVFDATFEKIIWELELDIIRKELDINVGRTTVRRARTRVLQEIMGDHIVEYAEMKDNIQAMKKLGQECLDDLLWYNLKHGARSIFKTIANVMLWTTIWQKALMLGYCLQEVVVADPGSSGAFLVLVVLLPFITRSWNQSIMWLDVIASRGAGTSRGRGIPQERNVNEGLGGGRGLTQHRQTNFEATCSGRGLERGKRPVEHEDTSGRQTRPFKRPRMVGIGIYQAEDGFTTLNPELPSRRVINIGTRVTKRADVVTGDIGYTPKIYLAGHYFGTNDAILFFGGKVVIKGGSEVKYESYKSDEIVVGQSILFLNLKAAISAELDIDVSRKNIEIYYIVEGNSFLMKIKNGMGVKLYLEVKKSESGFAIYPLCIDTSEKIGGDVHNFDGTCGEITCVEGTTQDTEALAVVESKICDSYYIPELEVTNYIIDSNSIEVKTGQLYKDKATLVDVKMKYKIKNTFNYKGKKFDRQRYFNSEHTCPMRNRVLTKVQATVEFVWCAKERALEMIRGKPSAGYRQMPRYIYMLNIVYSNSYIRMQKTEKDEFMYLFITLRPLIRGFDYCRSIVIVDGANMGRHYKRTFVSASTHDRTSRRRYIVCLERKVCSYGRFQLDEIPCAHAIIVSKEKNVKDMHPYCSDYYKPNALAKAYEIPMVPMPDKEDWSAPEDVVVETVYPP
ncbi:hypothetical protein H5410_042488 [Solanum commersonii]|uniref:PB1-like domain-containing protein n=1 Tax=Solanum commersonii TaxID=4109 RepID=A0A9J5XYQ0_SOLCO|nr:hypothetical protein H5410_042488 [Solanum commersonii]